VHEERGGSERGEEKRDAERDSPPEEGQNFPRAERSPERLEMEPAREVKACPSGEPEARCRTRRQELRPPSAKARHEGKRHTRCSDPEKRQRNDQRSEVVPMGQREESDGRYLMEEERSRERREGGEGCPTVRHVAHRTLPDSHGPWLWIEAALSLS
jgi:hypothetical protein